RSHMPVQTMTPLRASSHVVWSACEEVMHLPFFSARRARPWWPAAVVATLTGAALTLGGTAGVSTANAATPPVNVTVNAGEGLGTLPSTAYGLNQAVWDGQMNAPFSVNMLKQAGVQMMRFPGGSYGDGYNWRNNTEPGGFVAPGTDFDSFMGTVKSVGAQAV